MSRFSSSLNLMTISRSSLFWDGSTVVDKNLDYLKECMVEVAGLCIYEIPLEVKGLSKFVKHHFVFVEVSKVSRREGKKDKKVKNEVYIRAEKFGPTDKTAGVNTAGISVQSVNEIDPNIDDDDLGGRFRCQNVKVAICGAKLLEILSDHCPDYNVLEENCWKYAHSTCKLLLQELEEHGQEFVDEQTFGDLGPAARSRLNDFKKKLRPPIMFLDVVETSTVGGVSRVVASLLYRSPLQVAAIGTSTLPTHLAALGAGIAVSMVLIYGSRYLRSQLPRLQKKWLDLSSSIGKLLARLLEGLEDFARKLSMNLGLRPGPLAITT